MTIQDKISAILVEELAVLNAKITVEAVRRIAAKIAEAVNKTEE